MAALMEAVWLSSRVPLGQAPSHSPEACLPPSPLSLHLIFTHPLSALSLTEEGKPSGGDTNRHPPLLLVTDLIYVQVPNTSDDTSVCYHHLLRPLPPLPSVLLDDPTLIFCLISTLTLSHHPALPASLHRQQTSSSCWLHWLFQILPPAPEVAYRTPCCLDPLGPDPLPPFPPCPSLLSLSLFPDAERTHLCLVAFTFTISSTCSCPLLSNL